MRIGRPGVSRRSRRADSSPVLSARISSELRGITAGWTGVGWALSTWRAVKLPGCLETVTVEVMVQVDVDVPVVMRTHDVAWGMEIVMDLVTTLTSIVVGVVATVALAGSASKTEKLLGGPALKICDDIATPPLVVIQRIVCIPLLSLNSLPVSVE